MLNWKYYTTALNFSLDVNVIKKSPTASAEQRVLILFFLNELLIGMKYPDKLCIDLLYFRGLFSGEVNYLKY